MHVVLDTTALLADPFCDGTAWRALAHARVSWGLRLSVTEVSVEEAIAGYRRRVDDALVGLDRYVNKHHSLLKSDPGGAAAASVLDGLRDTYEVRLREALDALGVNILRVPDIPHAEIVRRSVSRRRPCDDSGNGYRDTLNWLTILHILNEDSSSKVSWVSENSKDFGDGPDRVQFHPDLIEDLAAIGAEQRLTWTRSTADQVIALATEHVPATSGDIGEIREILREKAIIEYINSRIISKCAHMRVSPRRCGLPLGTREAIITEIEKPGDIAARFRGPTGPDQSVIKFEFQALTSLNCHLFTNSHQSDSDQAEISAETSSQIVAELSKDLQYSGIVTIDDRELPISLEIVQISALPDDEGLLPWKNLRGGGLSTQLETIEALRRLGSRISAAELSGFSIASQGLRDWVAFNAAAEAAATMGRNAIGPTSVARLTAADATRSLGLSGTFTKLAEDLRLSSLNNLRSVTSLTAVDALKNLRPASSIAKMAEDLRSAFAGAQSVAGIAATDAVERLDTLNDLSENLKKLQGELQRPTSSDGDNHEIQPRPASNAAYKEGSEPGSNIDDRSVD